MTSIGTACTATATKMMLLGSGELGKEVAIEAQRYGIEVIAVDRYEHAPAMQVAHRCYVVDMLSGEQLATIIRKEAPNFIVPEIEAIATETLIELEQQGFCVIPTAQAAWLTMNREGIRRLAAEQLKLKTSNYFFADDFTTFKKYVIKLGFPCVVKPVMSSSGKGQSVVRGAEDIQKSWDYAAQGGRVAGTRVIIEQFIPFDYEITLLTVRHKAGISFCEPIGHRQEEGDYRESWQPHPMSNTLLLKAQDIATKITNALGGCGVFGVELFVRGDDVYFSEVSPRPHDTGMVTLISQNLSQFALHVRAILGLPIPDIRQLSPAASAALVLEGDSDAIVYHHVDLALQQPGTDLRLFGKPGIHGKRRLGVGLAIADGIEEAVRKAKAVVDAITM